jgi:hypothetical protein
MRSQFFVGRPGLHSGEVLGVRASRPPRPAACPTIRPTSVSDTTRAGYGCAILDFGRGAINLRSARAMFPAKHPGNVLRPERTPRTGNRRSRAVPTFGHAIREYRTSAQRKGGSPRLSAIHRHNRGPRERADGRTSPGTASGLRSFRAKGGGGSFRLSGYPPSRSCALSCGLMTIW